MKANNVKDWASLMRFIVYNYPPDISSEKIIKEIGIAYKSYYDIKKGKKKIIGQKLERKIRDFVKAKFNLEITVNNDFVGLSDSIRKQLIKEKPSSVARTNTDIQPNSSDKTINQLVQLLSEANVEIKRLKNEVKRLQDLASGEKPNKSKGFQASFWDS